MTKEIIELVRIDDVCDNMKNPEMLWNVLNMLHTYNVRPLVGVIPNNVDYKLVGKDSKFKIEDLKKHLDRIDVAMHGYRHKYENSNPGILKISDKSEFAGLSYEQQKEKITKGLKQLQTRLGIKPKFFFAPSHSYDKTTIKVLEEAGMAISDGISRYPFIDEIVHIPQCSGLEKKRLPGVYTLHLHPTTMTEKDYDKLRDYLLDNEDKFKTFDYVLSKTPEYLFKKSPMFNNWFRTKLSLYNLFRRVVNLKYNKGKRFIRGYLRKATLRKLQKVYDFDDWHLSPIELRPYALDIVKNVNIIIKEMGLTTAVEIGCGTGDIIGRLKCKTKVGFDKENNVIQAAKKLNGSDKCSFTVGSFKDVEGSEIDILIAVNFTHNIPPEELRIEFQKLTDKINIKYIVVDRVEYQYYHNWDKILPSCYQRFWDSRRYENGREFQIYRMVMTE